MAVEPKQDETQVAERTETAAIVSQEKAPGMEPPSLQLGGELKKKEESKPDSGDEAAVSEEKRIENGEKAGEAVAIVSEEKPPEAEPPSQKENGELKRKEESGPDSGEEKKIENEAQAEGAAEEKKAEAKSGESSTPSAVTVVEKFTSFREESNFLYDLKEPERKSLMELKSKLEEAIVENRLLFEEKDTEPSVDDDGKKKEKPVDEEKENAEATGGKEEPEAEQQKGKSLEGGEMEKIEEEKIVEPVDKDASLWGIPLLPSKGDERLNVILLKFLRARDFKADEAFEMLARTLRWRKENRIDSVSEEEEEEDYFEVDLLRSAAYMNGKDREGHPVCYNVYGVFGDSELYSKTFGSAEQREGFLRWRFQLMEKGIRKLDFKPGGVSSLLQINDLNNTPGPSKKELRLATKQAVDLLQDNYPEFVARNIFINVPFWYYAFYAVLSPFLTPRTKSKFVFARPARVTETLLKYIAAEEIPLKYGGLQRENDSEFSIQDGVLEVPVKAGATESIEIPTAEAGSVTVWDLTVLGWDVNYKEEFVPTDEGSYTIIIQKGKKMGWQEEPIRNSFRNNEPGKIVLTIENGLFKRKRALYRYKIKKSSSSS